VVVEQRVSLVDHERSRLLFRGRVRGQPQWIRFARVGRSAHYGRGKNIKPFVNFRMAVGEGKRASVAVKDRRQVAISAAAGRGSWISPEPSVVDACGILIEKYERVDRRGSFEIAGFDETLVTLSDLFPAVAGRDRVAGNTHEGIHGDGTDARLVIVFGLVRGAVIDAGIFGVRSERTEIAIGRANHFFCVEAVRATHLSGDPGGPQIGRRFADIIAVGAAFVRIGGKPFLVIAAVESAGELQLLHVVQAGNGLGSQFGLAQGGQEHGGEDRNDCDDDQEFDQCEGVFVTRLASGSNGFSMKDSVV